MGGRGKTQNDKTALINLDHRESEKGEDNEAVGQWTNEGITRVLEVSGDDKRGKTGTGRKEETGLEVK